MMNKIFNLALMPFLLCLGCQKNNSEQKKQTLRVNIHSEPPTLDPRKAHDTSSIHVIRMCFEGLMRRDDQNQPQLALAEKIELSEDAKTYVFYLRSSQWSDGKPLTAYDFEQTWKTILSPSFATSVASDFYVIKNAQKVKEGKLSAELLGVKALNEKTLIVNLERPVPYFLNLICSSYFFPVPQHIILHNPQWSDQAKSFIGNGPFVIKDWQHQNEIHLEKNPFYWDNQKVVLETVHLTIVEDETTELNMFESGELDWSGSPLSSLPPDAIQALAKQNRLHIYPMAGVYYYVFNVSKPPFHNANFRKALALAINREQIIKNITQASQKPALRYVPPLLWDIDKEHRYYEDAAILQARKFLALALKELDSNIESLPPITLSYNSAIGHHIIAQAIQNQWLENLGLRVKLENKEWKVFLDELAHGQFQVARLGGIANYHDPLSFLDTFRQKDHFSNYSSWSNESYCALIERAENTLDIMEREKILRQAEAILMEEMPVMPIYFYTGSYVKQPYVKGVYLSDLSDMDLKSAYIESK